MIQAYFPNTQPSSLIAALINLLSPNLGKPRLVCGNLCHPQAMQQSQGYQEAQQIAAAEASCMCGTT